MSKHLNFLIIAANALFLIACTNNGQEIDTVVLVVPDTYQGAILIFYEQNENKGHIEFKNGKHYFYVDSTGVFFTTKKLGSGNVESLSANLDKSNYSSEMSINDHPDEVFRVVGGAYRGFIDSSYKGGSKFLNFSAFKAGKAKFLKNGGWYVSDSLVEKLYRKYL